MELLLTERKRDFPGDWIPEGFSGGSLNEWRMDF